jgi:hypothetical protein
VPNNNNQFPLDLPHPKHDNVLELRRIGFFKSNETIISDFNNITHENSKHVFCNFVSFLKENTIINHALWVSGIPDFFSEKNVQNRSLLAHGGIQYFNDLHKNILLEENYSMAFIRFLVPYTTYEILDIFAAHWLLELVKQGNDLPVPDVSKKTLKENNHLLFLMRKKHKNKFSFFLQQKLPIDFSIVDNFQQNIFCYLAFSNNINFFDTIVAFYGNSSDNKKAIMQAIIHKNDQEKEKSPLEIAETQKEIFEKNNKGPWILDSYQNFFNEHQNILPPEEKKSFSSFCVQKMTNMF